MRSVSAEIESPPENSVVEQPRTPVAVVELFTSEGCSSCPAAEEFLASLVDKTQNRGPVYALSYHVDYWDGLGWKDPFASPIFSRRQKAYAKAHGNGEVFTPQMFVNGREGFIGSDRQKALKNIRMALVQVPAVGVELSIGVPKSREFLKVDYKILSGETEGRVLCMALVQSGIIRKVGSGENSGKTLRHENVVVGFKSVLLAHGAQGHIEFRFDPSHDLNQFFVIGYVQDPRTAAILGANRVGLNSESKIAGRLY